MVPSESSVFFQGHQSLGQGHLTPDTDPPALELKTIKPSEKIILENLSLNISVYSQDACLTRNPHLQAGAKSHLALSVFLLLEGLHIPTT